MPSLLCPCSLARRQRQEGSPPPYLAPAWRRPQGRWPKPARKGAARPRLPLARRHPPLLHRRRPPPTGTTFAPAPPAGAPGASPPKPTGTTFAPAPGDAPVAPAAATPAAPATGGRPPTGTTFVPAPDGRVTTFAPAPPGNATGDTGTTFVPAPPGGGAAAGGGVQPAGYAPTRDGATAGLAPAGGLGAVGGGGLGTTGGSTPARPQTAPSHEIVDVGPVTGSAGDGENTRGAFPERPERPPGSGPAALGFGSPARQNPPGGASFPGYDAGLFSGASFAATQPGVAAAAAQPAVKPAAAKAAAPPKPTIAPWDKIQDTPESQARIEEGGV